MGGFPAHTKRPATSPGPDRLQDDAMRGPEPVALYGSDLWVCNCQKCTPPRWPSPTRRSVVLFSVSLTACGPGLSRKICWLRTGKKESATYSHSAPLLPFLATRETPKTTPLPFPSASECEDGLDEICSGVLLFIHRHRLLLLVAHNYSPDGKQTEPERSTRQTDSRRVSSRQISQT